MNDTKKKGVKLRSNGSGAVNRLADGRYRAVITLDLYADKDENGKFVTRRKTRSRICDTKKAAYQALVDLRVEYEREKNSGRQPGQTPTLAEVYTAWEAWYEPNVSAQTMDCYRAAYKHLEPFHHTRMSEIGIDALQACLDKIPCGKRTKENTKTLISLLYKYAIPRRLTADGLNLGVYLRLNYDKSKEGYQRQSLTDDELRSLFALADDGDVDAKIICVCCLMGWRPDELLSLRIEQVDLEERFIIGGSKTEAGIDRAVPIHPRIYPYIVEIIGGRKSGFVFGNPRNGGGKRDLKRYREGRFYPCLERAGIDNPKVAAGGGTERRRITPHSCRHTFARLLKGVKDSPVETKLDIIGHTDEEQLRDYMDSTLPERRDVINKIELSF